MEPSIVRHVPDSGGSNHHESRPNLLISVSEASRQTALVCPSVPEPCCSTTERQLGDLQVSPHMILYRHSRVHPRGRQQSIEDLPTCQRAVHSSSQPIGLSSAPERKPLQDVAPARVDLESLLSRWIPTNLISLHCQREIAFDWPNLATRHQRQYAQGMHEDRHTTLEISLTSPNSHFPEINARRRMAITMIALS